MSRSEFRVTAARGFAWNYAYKISEFGLLNLYTILVVRHFGPAVSAPYSIFIATVSVLSMIGAFGVDGTLLRFIGRIAQNNSETAERFDDIESLTLPHFLNSLLAFRLLSIAIVSILSLGGIYALHLLGSGSDDSIGFLFAYAPYLVVFLFAQGLTAFSTFALTGLLSSKYVFLTSIVSRLLLMTLGFVLIASGGLSPERAIQVYVFSTLCSGIALPLILRSDVRKRSASGARKSVSFGTALRMVAAFVRLPRTAAAFLATPMLVYGMTTWGNDLLSLVLGKSTDIVMMGVILGKTSAEVGYYQVASLIVQGTEYVLLFGLSGTLVSVFSRLSHEDSSEQSGSYPKLSAARKEIAGFQQIVVLPLACYVLFYIEPIVRALFGVTFDPSITIVRTGLVALILSVGIFGGGMQITTLVSIGKERIVFRNRLVWGIINTVGNVILIICFGAIGALIGTQYSNLGAVATEAYYAKKFVGKAVAFSAFVRIGLVSVAVSAGTYFVMNRLFAPSSYWMIFCIGGAANILISIAIFMLMKAPEFERIRKRLMHVIER